MEGLPGWVNQWQYALSAFKCIINVCVLGVLGFSAGRSFPQHFSELYCYECALHGHLDVGMYTLSSRVGRRRFKNRRGSFCYVSSSHIVRTVISKNRISVFIATQTLCGPVSLIIRCFLSLSNFNNREKYWSEVTLLFCSGPTPTSGSRRSMNFN